MNEENKNRYILVLTIILLLVSVVVIGVLLAFTGSSKAKDVPKVELKQIYASEYELKVLNDAFYIGMYDNKLSAIIDKDGLEVFTSDFDISFDSYYKMQNGNYLFYDYNDGYLTTFIFNGSDLSQSYSFDVYSEVKPILINNGNERFILSFAYTYENNLYILDISKGTSVVLNNLYLENYELKNNYLVVKNEEGKYGVVDISGNIVIPCEYDSVQGTFNDTFIVSIKGKSYVLDTFNNIIGDQFNKIYGFKDCYVVLNKKNKMALYDVSMNPITNFELDYTSGSSLDVYLQNKNVFVKMDDKFYVIGTDVKKYDGILYKINGSFVYYFDSMLYILDENMNISKEISVCDSCNFVKLTTKNSFIELSLKELDKEFKKYYDYRINEMNAKDNLVYVTDKYYVYLNNKDDIKELVITGTDNSVITNITGVNIVVNRDYIIVDNSIYKIVAE